MADDSGIDPRYAAQFQRGYDPERHPAAPAAPPRDLAAPVRLPGGPVTHAERVSATPVARPGPPLHDTESPASGDDVPEHGETADSRPVPWVEWALPVLGVVLLLAAIWIFAELVFDKLAYLASAFADQRDNVDIGCRAFRHHAQKCRFSDT